MPCIEPKLSIILPLKDRTEFTPRIIDCAKEVGRLIFADGSAARDPNLASHCQSYGDYFYSGPDDSLSRWWFKMCLALDRVRTPYAMVADNDDLLVPSGIAHCVDFLERNPDYVACSGRLVGFWVWPNQVVGPRFAVSRRPYGAYDMPADYGQPDTCIRVLKGFKNSWSYYAVYRTEALKTIWEDVKDLDFTDLQVHEKYCAMRALTLGKIICHPAYVSYMRQIGTSGTAGKLPTFAERLMTRNTSIDRDKVLNKMETLGVDREMLRMLWAQWYEAYLRREYGAWPQIRKAAKKRWPRLAWAVQNRHRWGLA